MKGLAGRLGLGARWLLLAGAACAAYGFFIEATWLDIRRVTLPELGDRRLVFISDLHYRGDTDYLRRIVAEIDVLNPDMVLHGGDLVERPERLAGALEILSGLDAPLYAVLGNHEYWGGIDENLLDSGLRRTGGRLLKDSWVALGGCAIIGLDDYYSGRPNVDAGFNGTDSFARILCIHEPRGMDLLEGRSYALALSGHSHGGQVRLPLLGAILLPPNVRPYQLGRYELPGGPLLVSSGLGTWHLDVRFLCRPEIVLISSGGG